MSSFKDFRTGALAAIVATSCVAAAADAVAGINGHALTPGQTVNLTTRESIISSPDGTINYMWLYSLIGGADNGWGQYPGPTFFMQEGESYRICVNNGLGGTAIATNANPAIASAANVSFTVLGLPVTADTGTGVPGIITQEAEPNQTVCYDVDATHPGTFLYQSATRPELQLEMGLQGAIIVRPAGYSDADPATWQAYGSVETRYDYEYLFFLTDIDPHLHEMIFRGQLEEYTAHRILTTLWFINGRNGPDTMLGARVPWMPSQPYNALPRVRPNEIVLGRVIGAGRAAHPFHTHGNNFRTVAVDGQLQESIPGAGPDLGISDFTLGSFPGQTVDFLWHWTGRGMGWDIWEAGHTCPLNPADPAIGAAGSPCVNVGTVEAPDWCDSNVEDCNPADEFYSHGKPVPVSLPKGTDALIGGFYSGSPFLGTFGYLPPGEGGLNLNGGLVYMWHSHNEKELTNNDIFPGGMLTMMIVEPFVSADDGSAVEIPTVATAPSEFLW